MAQRIWAILAVAAAALSACGKPAPAAKAKIDGAFHVAPPAPKAGLWRISTSGAAKQTTRLCIDEASAGELGPGAGPADGACAEHSWTRRADGALVFTSVCDMGARGTRRATAVLSGDMTRAYRMTVNETVTGAAAHAANGRRRFSLSAEWAGPCPAGWTGGDIGLDGGVRFNLLKGRQLTSPAHPREGGDPSGASG